jgi:hypothetical protein
LGRGPQNFAILAGALSLGSGSTPAGPEGRDVSGSASGALTMAPTAGAVATRGNTPWVGEFRFRPLGLSAPHPGTAGRIPVALVHGLWGGPRMWEPMAKTLEDS